MIMKFEETEGLCMISRRERKMTLNETANETWFMCYTDLGKRFIQQKYLKF